MQPNPHGFSRFGMSRGAWWARLALYAAIPFLTEVMTRTEEDKPFSWRVIGYALVPTLTVIRAFMDRSTAEEKQDKSSPPDNPDGG